MNCGFECGLVATLTDRTVGIREGMLMDSLRMERRRVRSEFGIGELGQKPSEEGCCMKKSCQSVSLLHSLLS